MSWDGLAGDGVEYVSSPLESSRFGVTVGRLTCGTDVDDTGPGWERLCVEVVRALRSAPDDVVVVRYPARVVALAGALAAGGRELLPAGALTYWAAPADEVTAPEGRPDGVRVVGARDGDARLLADVLDTVVADSFAGYANHYRANPLLADDAALAGYQEWARRSLEQGADDVLVLATAAGDPVGVATCVASRQPGSHLEVLLAGLVGAAQGRGDYGVLLAACAREAAHRGLGRLVISTQVHNVRVQRAWARAGLRPVGAVETVHAVRPGLLDRAGSAQTSRQRA